MVALERALDWQSLFDLAVTQRMSTEEMEEMAYRVSGASFSVWLGTNCSPPDIDDLTSKKRYADAGRVLLEYTKDTKATVIALASGNLFSEARRIVRHPPRIVPFVHSHIT